MATERSRSSRGKPVYRVRFLSQGSLYEIYARKVTQGDIYAFVTIEDLLFGARSQVVLDPTEERLKAEFAGVKRFHVPLHAVVRIDEVDREGSAKITPSEGDGGKVMPFPVAVPPGTRG
jgi:hypothetical protein